MPFWFDQTWKLGFKNPLQIKHYFGSIYTGFFICLTNRIIKNSTTTSKLPTALPQGISKLQGVAFLKDIMDSIYVQKVKYQNMMRVYFDVLKVDQILFSK